MAIAVEKPVGVSQRLSVPTFLNWAGSKRRVAQYLVNANLPKFEIYHEPFLGSGAMYLGLAKEGFISNARLSDINRHIVGTFKGVLEDPSAVIRSLKLHKLLDSDVHFASVLRRVNDPKSTTNLPDRAADIIYLLDRTFHSSWYETRSGRISLSRRSTSRPFRPPLRHVTEASALLINADIAESDFRQTRSEISTGDLVFVDPPYLTDADMYDPRSYNMNRFSRDDLHSLIDLMGHAINRGAHVIFCWNIELNFEFFRSGTWHAIGRDHVWISYS